MKKIFFICMMIFQCEMAFCEPTLILLSGPPGWGKSTLSEKLAATFKLVRLDFDSVAEPFSPGKRDSSYANDIEPRIAEAIVNLAKYNFSAGNSVIIDATWSHLFYANKKYLEMIEGLVKNSGAKLIVFQGVLDEETILERIRTRNDLRDRPKLENPESFFVNDHVRLKNPLEPHYEISGHGREDEVFERARKLLEKLM